MAILHSAFGVILLATTSGSVLASAQSTTTHSTTSTSWALLDNTDLFPKQTTPAAAAAASSSSSSSTTTPTTTTTTTGDGFQITPPIPCPGLYYTYGGICCAGAQLLDCDYDALHTGAQSPASCCPPGQFVWALPLSDDLIARAEARGDYSGCPGNMRNGVCCSGGVIYQDDGREVCSLGSVVWVETTGVGGKVGTSTVAAVGTTTTAGSSGTGGRGTATAAGAGATATVTVTGGGASLGGGWAAADGGVWWWGAMALGVLGRW